MSELALARDTELGAAVLQVANRNKKLRSINVISKVTDGSIDRTMDGASTLTLTFNDHRRDMLQSGILERQIDMKVEGLWWRLVKVSKQGDNLTLTFEDRQVSLLRQITTPRKAARAKMTRAEFALSIVREVKGGGGIPFVSPDLHTAQPIAAPETQPGTTTTTQPDTTAAGLSQGIAKGTSLTVKHAAASQEQKTNGETALQIAASLNAGTRATLALLMACIQESTMRNLSYGDSTSTGILQLLSSTAQGLGIDARDVAACCTAFLQKGFTGRGGAIALAAKNPSWTPGQVAQGVQGSAYPTAYDQWQKEAQSWINAFGGVAGGGNLSTTTTVKKLPYQFQRGGTDGTPEDSWTCLQRLAQEVGWRCFMADGSCFFVAETTLIKAKPLAVIDETATRGVFGIDFDVDNGKPASECTVTARAGVLAFPPGSVMQLKNVGPANGRWLVAEISRGLFDASTTIRLKRATEPLPEPAPETNTITSDSSTPSLVGSAGAGVPTEIDQAYQTAASIHAKRYPYVWGGGHAHVGTADRGTGRDPGIGFDCSGSTCAVLAGGGMGFRMGGPADVSGTIASSWGQAGEGQFLTVWANSVHVWMEFKGSSGPQHFGTGDWGKGWGGAGFNPRMHPTAGFTPRHWPGT